MNETIYPECPVLIVDDEQTAITGSQLILESEGIENTLSTTDSRDVMRILATSEISAVLLDLSMPHITGEELLPQIVEGFPEVPVIIVTGHNEVEIAIECMKKGAFDYLVKPVHETRLSSAVKRAIEFRELRSEYSSFKQRVLSDKLETPDAFEAFVTNNQKIKNLFQYVETIATSPRPVLITGETGVGKELIARAIHNISGRQGAFVSVNVAGLDDTVFSDTLFGHLKGAFTGAETARKGLIEKAGGGTLFLDEIGDMDMTSQIKLLRLLQENEYYPLGADAAKLSEARILVATNKDLKALQQEGFFRADLYFRLQTHHVDIPPLRERLDDIPVLLNHFLEKAACGLNKNVPTPPKELPLVLASYHFPGNVREMEGMVFDALSHHKSKILSMESFKNHIRKHQNQTTETLSGKSDDYSEASPFALVGRLPTLAESQSLLIQEALNRASGNQTVAAQMLGITRSGLSKAIKRKKLTKE